MPACKGTWVITFVAMVSCSVMTLAMRQSATVSRATKLTVTVKSVPKDPLSLEIGLALEGQRPIRVDRLALPWESSYALVLAAAELPRGWPIRRGPFPVEDPSPSDTTIIIQPGRPISGTVDLRQRFVELPKMLRDSDVIVFWSYQLIGTIGDRASWTSERSTGSVILKRSSAR